MAKQIFEGGATRSEQDCRYDLIPPAALRALARRLKLGADRHGEHNWESGGEAFRRATLSHLMAHLQDYLERGNTMEPNTDAIICNAAFLCFFEERSPYKPFVADHARLEFEASAAYSHCTGLLEGALAVADPGYAGSPWLNTNSVDDETPAEEVKSCIAYLEERGLIDHHPLHPHWIQLRDEDEPLEVRRG